MAKKQLKFQSSWDDGHSLDIKLANILRDFRLPAIFYLPTTTCDLSSREIFQLAQQFEIGGHGYNHHQDMKLLDDPEIDFEVLKNKEWLESILGHEITKFCYPRGRYDERVIDSLTRAGYKESRTTIALKFDEDEKDPFRKPTTIQVYQRKEYNGTHWMEVAKYYAELARRKGKTFHIWGHSKEIDRDGHWQQLHEFFSWITENYEIV